MNLNTKLIRDSYEEIKPFRNEIFTYFYKVLFEKFPESRSFFEQYNAEAQKEELIVGIEKVVTLLGTWNELTAYLHEAGKNLVPYQLNDDHYTKMGKTFLATMKYYFKEHWTAELENQWILVLGLVADKLIEGAKVHELPQQQNSAKESSKPTEHSEFADPAVQLGQMARQIAKNVLYRALEDEVSENFVKHARKKVYGILIKVLKEEGEQLQMQFPPVNKKAA